MKQNHSFFFLVRISTLISTGISKDGGHETVSVGRAGSWSACLLIENWVRSRKLNHSGKQKSWPNPFAEPALRLIIKHKKNLPAACWTQSMVSQMKDSLFDSRVSLVDLSDFSFSMANRVARTMQPASRTTARSTRQRNLRDFRAGRKSTPSPPIIASSSDMLENGHKRFRAKRFECDNRLSVHCRIHTSSQGVSRYDVTRMRNQSRKIRWTTQPWSCYSFGLDVSWP